jgi:hypothetical protein
MNEFCKHIVRVNEGINRTKKRYEIFKCTLKCEKSLPDITITLQNVIIYKK